MKKELHEVKLSEWAKTNDIPYKKAHALYQTGGIPLKSKVSKTGRISLLTEIKASANAQNTNFAIPLMANKNEKTEISASSRRNKAATSTPTDEYFHINSGVTPFMTSGKDGSNISVTEAIRLCQKCYYNFSSLKNTVDLMTEFSTNKIYFRGGTAKSRKFFENLFESLNILDFQDKFFREYYRSSNVFIYRFNVKLKSEDIKELITAFELQAKKGIELPSKYIILNPADISCKGNINFSDSLFCKILNGYELNRLKNPQTEYEKNFLKSLPTETQKDIKQGNVSVEIPLNPEETFAIFFKKQDYESLAVPMAYPVLKDINLKAELKNIDRSVSRTMNNVILHIKMGYLSKSDEYMYNQDAANQMQQLFESESVGKTLVTDFSTEVEHKIPNIGSFLDPKKYEIVNQDIKEGLNSLISGSTDSKFANQFIQTQIFIQRLQQAREAFLIHFLIPEIKRISNEMGFKGKIPTPRFVEFDLKDPAEMNRIIAQLYQYGLLAPSEALRALEDGVMPTGEESLMAQEEFRTQKDKGFYEPITGGGSFTQNQILDKTNKNQMKLLDKTQEHDDKQKNKQRKHEAENPQAPAPQIVLNAPTKMGQPSGKPTGKTGKQSKTRNTRPMSASLEEEQYSINKITLNIILAQKLKNKICESLIKKHKLKELNAEQKKIADEITQIIISNEESDKWLEKSNDYIENPVNQNEERLQEVDEIGANHGLNPFLSSILLASKKE